MHIRKPWTEWDDSMDLRELPGAMGIYEIADEQQQTLYIGKASGRDPFGLRGELVRTFAPASLLEGANWLPPRMGDVFAALRGARYYRYEVNHQYYGRWLEALSRYLEDHGELPAGNLEDPEPLPKLGRFHWKTGE